MLTQVESDRLERKYPGKPKILPPSPAECLTCGGDKTFRWYSQTEPTEVVTYDCNCVEQWIAHRYFLSRGVNRRYQTLGWNDFVGDPTARDVVQTYIAAQNECFRTGMSLYLWGGIGTGKTLLGSL